MSCAENGPVTRTNDYCEHKLDGLTCHERAGHRGFEQYERFEQAHCPLHREIIQAVISNRVTERLHLMCFTCRTHSDTLDGGASIGQVTLLEEVERFQNRRHLREDEKRALSEWSMIWDNADTDIPEAIEPTAKEDFLRGMWASHYNWEAKAHSWRNWAQGKPMCIDEEDNTTVYSDSDDD